MANSNLWYVRRAGKVQGPFPAGLVSRYILLGRIHAEDELSQDREQWLQALECDQLVPEVMKTDPGDPQARERLEAARRWADERSAVDARSEPAERRSHPSIQRPQHASVPSMGGARDGGHRYLWQLALIVVALGVVVTLAVLYTPSQVVSFADCAAPAAPGVNWSNCKLQGIQLVSQNLSDAKLYSTDLSGASLYGSTLTRADLAYANLSLADLRHASMQRASLVGVNLRRAKLDHADFTDADLSYADLSGAHLGQSRLAGAKLDNAIWVDRRTCMPGSLGRCVLAPES